MGFFRNHPKGLVVLFSTEMWERFNFYGMRVIMGLYMVHSLGYSEADAAKSYGAYLGLGYLTTMLGGYLADRYWGTRLCLYVGSIMMFVAQFLLFISGSVFDTNLPLAKIIFFIAILLLILGTGIFKPNISSMVGSLYNEKDARIDSAYTIFYMGINIGALTGMIVCSMVGDSVHVSADGHTFRTAEDLQRFRWGFLSASIAMLLGFFSFYIFSKYIRNPQGELVGCKPLHRVGPVDTSAAHTKPVQNYIAPLLTTVLTVILTSLFYWVSREKNAATFDTWISLTYAFIYGLGISLVVRVIMDRTLNAEERKKIVVLIICSFFVIFFWAAFEQSGSSLTFIANNQTDARLFGIHLPPSSIQSFNGLFVILLAPVAVFIWSLLAKRNCEPNPFVKLAMGLLLLAAGYYIIALAVTRLDGHSKIALSWFVILYLLHTAGELCLSPIGLSLVYKLSPKRILGLLIGIWFVASSTGYALAGTLGALLPPSPEAYTTAQQHGIALQDILNKTQTPTAEQLSWLNSKNIPTQYPSIFGIQVRNLYDFFMVFVVMSASAGVLLLTIAKKLNRTSKL